MQDIRGHLEVYKKQDIAMQYFNLALVEYIKGENMFAVLHLAGAAEEMFGEIVSFRSCETSLDRIHRSIKSWYRISKKDLPKKRDLNNHILKVKNGIKHIDHPKDLEIEFDINREAKEMIRRAIENFIQLPELKQSKELLAYYKHEKA